MFEHDDSIVLPTLKQRNLDSGRVYEVIDGTNKGAVYPSITRVLAARPKPQLEAWRQRVGVKEAARITSRAGVQGTNIHTLTERYVGNLSLPDISVGVQELWIKLRPWIDTNIIRVYHQETDVYSEMLGVAGRFDLLAEVKDVGLAIVDFKTAARRKKPEWVEDYRIQASFYACALYELTGKKARKAFLPLVSPDGLQVFEVEPAKHVDALIERVNEFYELTADPF